MPDADRQPVGTVYHIRVRGSLDSRWAEYFEGFTLTSNDSGETLLSGAVTDQAELHGILAKIRDLGLPLLMVSQDNLHKEEK